MRYYKIKILMTDDFEDENLEDSEMTVEDIKDYMERHELPSGFVISEVSVTKLTEGEFNDAKRTDRSSN